MILFIDNNSSIGFPISDFIDGMIKSGIIYVMQLGYFFQTNIDCSFE